MNETPSKRPTTKIQAAALGGAVASVLMGVFAVLYPEQYKLIPAGFEGGLATIAAVLLGYFVRERV